MMLFWKIRYLDRSDRQIKDRCLYLHTKTLDPITRGAVELVAQNRSSKTEREILNYRHLFTEGNPGADAGDPTSWGVCSFVGPSEYFEDEAGKEVTLHEMGPILTGSPTARLIPSGARQHDIDLMLSEATPIPVAEVPLNPEEVRLLGYFSRDLQEMMDSAFRKDRPGTLKMSGSPTLGPSSNPRLETAATDDEIRSFVTIFRRLYMEKEPANFQKATAVFVKSIGEHPYAKWVACDANAFHNHLAAVPVVLPFSFVVTFTTKRLIDVFLYTQYAHQPDEKRQKQFIDCLSEVHGQRAFLTWLFLCEIWKCSLEIGNTGRVISRWFKTYCAHHGISPDVLQSLREDHLGLGAAEKDEERRDRLFREKSEELAMELWQRSGSPQGGYTQFLATAREQLARRLQG